MSINLEVASLGRTEIISPSHILKQTDVATCDNKFREHFPVFKH
jgi:hypothetical protein